MHKLQLNELPGFPLRRVLLSWLVLPLGIMGWAVLYWLWAFFVSPAPALAQERNPLNICHAVPPSAETEADIVQWIQLTIDGDAWDEHESAHSDHQWDFAVDEENPCPPEENGDGEGNGEDGNGEDGNGDLPENGGDDDENGGEEGNGEPPVDSGDGPSPTNGTTPSTCPLGYELTVVAVMADWTPIPGVEVLVQRGAESFTVVTGESGEVSFPADFGLYRFTVLSAPQFSWRELVLETTLGAGSEDDRGVCWDDVVFIDPPGGADMRGFGVYLLLYGIGLWLAHFEYRRMARDIKRQ